MLVNVMYVPEGNWVRTEVDKNHCYCRTDKVGKIAEIEHLFILLYDHIEVEECSNVAKLKGKS